MADKEVLERYRLLLTSGVGNVKFIGHRLIGEEIAIASKLLAGQSESIKIENNLGSQKQIKTVLDKLNSCSVEVNLPSSKHSFLMLSSYSISSVEVSLKLNDNYKKLFHIL